MARGAEETSSLAQAGQFLRRKIVPTKDYIRLAPGETIEAELRNDDGELHSPSADEPALVISSESGYSTGKVFETTKTWYENGGFLKREVKYRSEDDNPEDSLTELSTLNEAGELHSFDSKPSRVFSSFGHLSEEYHNHGELFKTVKRAFDDQAEDVAYWDPDGRLHREDGPARFTRDGESDNKNPQEEVYAFHGKSFPATPEGIKRWSYYKETYEKPAGADNLDGGIIKDSKGDILFRVPESDRSLSSGEIIEGLTAGKRALGLSSKKR